MRELKSGDVVAGFIVKERIGQGGMGEVYLVRDPKLAVDRAMKIISLSGPGFSPASNESAEYRMRFVREARTLAHLRHPNIITVHSFGEVEGSPYLVMSHFSSRDARTWLKEENPTLERIADVALQTASALEHAHENGVLHRDIKLTNILVGEGDEAMLIDFGLAKGKLDSNLTRTGRSMGTFAYLAPEYVKASTEGKPTHTVLTDLWAFGCVLYALTCRRAAFADKDELRLLGLIQAADFKPVKSVRPDVPDAWAGLIHRLLERDPVKRIQSATELVALLRSMQLDAPVAASPPAEPSVAPAPQLTAAPKPEPAVAPEVELDVDVVDGIPASIADVMAERSAHSDDRHDIDDDAGRDHDADGAETEACEQSLFSHSIEHASAASTKTPPLARPTFDAPAESATSARAVAKRKLFLPLSAAVAVFIVGGSLIAWSDRVRARPAASRAAAVEADADERARGEREVEAIDRERDRLAAAEKTSAVAAPMAYPLVPVPTKESAPPATAQTVAFKPAPAMSASLDPWAKRYGTRTNFNTSSSATGSPSSSTATTPSPKTASTLAGAGVRIPVQVRDAITSSPPGPVIAIVEEKTEVGAVMLPVGTEIHGRIAGSSGPRILVEFSFAIVDGVRVPLRGVALASDGRAGVPAQKTLGGASSIAAGAAASAAQAALDAAAGAIGGVAGAAVRGGTTPVVAKSARIDNDDETLVTQAGARFFVYVES